MTTSRTDLVDRITFGPQCVLSSFTRALSSGHALSNCNPITQAKLFFMPGVNGLNVAQSLYLDLLSFAREI